MELLKSKELAAERCSIDSQDDLENARTCAHLNVSVHVLLCACVCVHLQVSASVNAGMSLDLST